MNEMEIVQLLFNGGGKSDMLYKKLLGIYKQI
jgi:hypothetical protein